MNGWVRLLVAAVVLGAGIVTSAVALNGKVERNSAKLEAQARELRDYRQDMREMRQDIKDIWRAVVRDPGR